MDESKFFFEAITFCIGSALILMYSFDRFNTPPSNRALTTAVRYYTSASAYMLTYLSAYCILLYYPNLMNWLLKMANENIDIPDSLPSAVVGAILLSILIPKLPVLSKIDSKLRKFLQNLAAIPIQALKLSGEMQNAKFVVPEKLVEKIKKYMLEHSFDERDFNFDETDTAEFIWIKNTALILQLATWEKDDRFVAFLSERSGQFKRLEERYKRLRAMALNCFSLSRQIAGDEKEDSLIKALNKVNTNFKDQAEDLFKEICHFLSQGVLKCQLTHGSRCRELKHMGFQNLENVKYSRSLNIHQMVTITGILLVLLLLNFILIAPNTWSGRDKTLLMITMIVSIYSISVYCAIYPKDKYAFFRRNEENSLPVAGYFISGLCAVIIAIPVSVFFKTLIFMKGPTDLYQAMVESWKSFYSSSYPWMIMAFVTAPTTSFLSDYGPGEKIPEIWWRFIQAATQAVITVLAALFVLWWLQGIHPNGMPVPNKTSVVGLSAAVGFSLGFIIPYWYRCARDKECKMEEIDQALQDSDLVQSEI